MLQWRTQPCQRSWVKAPCSCMLSEGNVVLVIFSDMASEGTLRTCLSILCIGHCVSSFLQAERKEAHQHYSVTVFPSPAAAAKNKQCVVEHQSVLLMKTNPIFGCFRDFPVELRCRVSDFKLCSGSLIQCLHAVRKSQITALLQQRPVVNSC